MGGAAQARPHRAFPSVHPSPASLANSYFTAALGQDPLGSTAAGNNTNMTNNNTSNAPQHAPACDGAAAWGAMGGGLSAGRAGSMPHDALLHVSATHAAADGHVAGHEAAGAAHGGGEQDAQGAAAAATAAVVPPSRRGGALMTPDAELCAKSIEDRLWGTVERIVSSAHDPADGAR